MTSLVCSVDSDPGALERLTSEWSELCARSGDELSLSPAWLHSWWQVFGGHDGRKLRLFTFRRDGRLVAIAPLCSRRYWYQHAVPFRRLELLGSGEPEEDEICSDYVGLIVERGAEEEVARAFAAALAGDDSWDELMLPSMDGGHPLPVLLASALARAGCFVELSHSGEAPYIPLPSSWEAYLAGLPSNHRYVVNRSLRDWEKWSGAAPKLERVTRVEELPRGQSLLRSLHSERWGGDGTFRSPRFGEFHDRVMPLLFERGALELAWISAHGEAVAVLYNIHWNDKVYFYQSGRQMQVPKQIRPGIVAHACAIRDAIAAGRREYDFLAGTSQYKMQLAQKTRPLLTVRASRSPLLEGVRRAGEAFRRLRARLVVA